jgi:hypothetical protein
MDATSQLCVHLVRFVKIIYKKHKRQEFFSMFNFSFFSKFLPFWLRRCFITHLSLYCVMGRSFVIEFHRHIITLLVIHGADFSFHTQNNSTYTFLSAAFAEKLRTTFYFPRPPRCKHILEGFVQNIWKWNMRDVSLIWADVHLNKGFLLHSPSYSLNQWLPE